MQSKIIKDEFVINWKRTFLAPFKRLWIIIVCAIIGAAAGIGGSILLSKPVYVCNAVYLVSFDNGGALDDILGQLNLSKSLLYNCETVAKQNVYRNTLEEELNKGVEKTSENYLNDEFLIGAISYSRSSSSGTFLYVNVQTEDPKLSKKIMDVITAEGELQMVDGKEVMVYPNGSFIGYMTEAFTFRNTSVEFKLVNEPELPEKPTSQLSKKLYGLIGAVAAAMVTYLVLCVIELSDKKIKEVEDITGKYNAPVLGVLYNFESSELNYGGDNYVD